MLLFKCCTHSLCHTHIRIGAILYIITRFCFTSCFVVVFKIIISNYCDNVQCACYLIHYNASYIFGLRDLSMTDCNMAYWFRDFIYHITNFGKYIIVVFIFLSHDDFYLLFDYIFWAFVNLHACLCNIHHANNNMKAIIVLIYIFNH